MDCYTTVHRPWPDWLSDFPYRSYLQYIPSRYGTSECLTAATNCVLGKVKMILAPHLFSCQETMIYLYAKALKTLQDAISDDSKCLDSDVLCATQLLSLHEVPPAFLIIYRGYFPYLPY